MISFSFINVNEDCKKKCEKAKSLILFFPSTDFIKMKKNHYFSRGIDES